MFGFCLGFLFVLFLKESTLNLPLKSNSDFQPTRPVAILTLFKSTVFQVTEILV